MNIIYLYPYDLKDISSHGSGKKLLNYLKYFSKNNNIYLIGFDNGLNQDEKNILKNYCKIFLFPEPSSINKFLNHFSLLFLGKSNYFSYSKKIEDKISNLISENKIDLIQAESLGMVEYAFNLNSEIKTCFLNDDIVLRRFLREIKNSNNILRTLWLKMQISRVKKLEQKCLNKFDLILTVTLEEKQFLLDLNSKSNIEVYSIGVNLNEFNLQKESHEGFNMLFLANFSHSPNIDAFKYLDEEIMPNIDNKEIKLLVTGNNAPQPNSNNIKCLGFVKNLGEVLSKTDLVISPVRLGGGIRIKNLEAMANGLTVLTSEIGNEGINGIDNQNILLANSKQEFIDKINWTYSNKEKLKQIGLEGKNLMQEKFDARKINQNLEEIFQKY